MRGERIVGVLNRKELQRSNTQSIDSTKYHDDDAKEKTILPFVVLEVPH
jgi:hypothetical protein